MSKSSPLVSIGLIAYNRGAIIDQSIKSLLSQSYKNIELIISDDASRDETSSICQKFVTKDKRVKLYIQKKNIGLAANSNFVLSKGRGKYFMWASDDDLWHKDFIKELVTLSEKNPKAALAMSNFYIFKKSKKYHTEPKLSTALSGLDGVKTYLSKTPLLVWGLFRTKILKEAGGFHEDKRFGWIKGSDFITVFKVLFQGDAVFSKKTLFFKRDSGFATDRREILKDFKLDKDMRLRVKRYLGYFIMFFYDFSYILKFNFQSSFNIYKKIKMCLYCVLWYLKVNTNHLSEIFGGVFIVIKSFIAKRN